MMIIRNICKTFALLPLIALGACTNNSLNEVGKAGIIGSVIGAGTGAIVGSRSGNAGAGVAIGAALGAASGAAVGYGQKQNNDRLRATDQAIARQETQIAENQRILDELKRQGLDARITDDGVVVNLPDVLFEFDSNRLTNSAISKINHITKTVKAYPERDLLVAGHTDSVGTMEYNQNLSDARARSVADELVYQGVSRSRVFAKGYGETKPVASNSTQSGRAQNRRVEVIIRD